MTQFNKKNVQSFGAAVALGCASLLAIAGTLACSRESKNPKIQIRVVDTAPKTTSVPVPDGSKPLPEVAKPAPEVLQPAPVASKTGGTDSPKKGEADSPASPAAVRPVTWALVNEKVVALRCAKCHSGARAAAGLDLTTAVKFKEAAPNIYAFVFYPPEPESKMPLGGDLTAEQKQILGDYMVDGLLP